MGHIVNATSTRIGSSTIWYDTWYTETLYYSEFLHSIFRLRSYLVYIFTRKYLDKYAIFYSHFNIIKLYKYLNIEIYLYDGKLESDYEDLKFEFFLQHYNLDINKDPETRIPKFIYTPLKYIIIWKYLENLDLDYYLYKDHYFIENLAGLLREYDIIELFYYFKRLRNLRLVPIWNFINFNLRMLLFLCLYIHSKNFLSKWSVFKKIRRNTILRRYYIYIVTTIYSDIYIEPFSLYLSYIFSYLTKFTKINVNFFLTNNNCVNAKFLSRFIARKLKQNYPVKQLLNPIRKELILVIKMCSISKRSYVKKIQHQYSDYLLIKINLLNTLINLIKNYYNNFLLNLFLINKTLFSLDLLLVYLWMNESIMENKNLIKISLKYFLRKSIHLCFFENNLDININKYIYLPKIVPINFINKNLIFGFLKIIYENFYTHKLSMINIILKNFITQTNLNSFRSSNINFNRYLKYYYLNYKYKFINKSKINNLKSRNKFKHKTNNNIIGYKMHLRGRFKRKQRAGSYWFSKGNVPLNSITAHIDYAYFTIPLINSAITVKVWLYKSNNIDNNYFYKIN